jgi:hypothetical protein
MKLKMIDNVNVLSHIFVYGVIHNAWQSIFLFFIFFNSFNLSSQVVHSGLEPSLWYLDP